MTKEKVFAFECRHKGSGVEGRIINSKTAGKARYQYYLDLSECWPGVTFMDIAVRKIGGPHTSERFIHNAKYRGMPDVRCGQRVKIGESLGTIVGHNSSANFDVLFDEDSGYKGNVLNVHPCEVVLV